MKKLIIIALLTTCLTSYGQVFVLDSLNDEGLKKYEVASSLKSNPLFILSLDSQVIEIKHDDESNKSLLGLDPNWISSVHVYKGQDALDKYGDRARYGAVLIDLKMESADKLPPDLKKKFAESKN
jgi:CheY-like chemotaxis protein